MCINNEKGFLTIDFIFSLVVSVGLCVLFFVLAFTLSTTEVAQYIAFSVGRTYSAGHINVLEQEDLARKKFTNIMSVPGMGKLFRQGWFELGFDTPAFRSGVNGEIYQEYGGSQDGTRLANTGTRLLFKTNLFNINLGVFGSTNPTGENFTTKITGFMIRNPTQDECQTYMSVGVRHRALIELDQRYEQYDKTPGTNQHYLPMDDNGC